MARIKHFNKLYIRVSLVIACIAMLISAVSAYLVFRASLEQQQQVSALLVNQLASSVERTAAIAAYLDDPELAIEITNGLELNDLVSAASISSTQSLSVLSGEISVTSVPINLPLVNPFIDDDVIGSLKVYPDLGFIRQSANSRAKLSAYTLLSLSLLTTLFVSLIVHKLFANPLSRLTDGFDSVNPNAIETMQPIDIGYKKQDEIGLLIGGINALMLALKKVLINERTLREKTEILEKRFRLIFERASAGIAVIDGQDGMYASNEAFCRIMNFDPSSDKKITDLFINKADVLKALNQVRGGNDEDQITLDLPFVRSGQMRFAHCLFARITDERGEQRDRSEELVEVIVYDITERLNREKQTRFEADHDSLTQLKNRRSGEEALNELLKEALVSKEIFVLMMIDLDKFKPINDNYGHDVGDEVLVCVSHRMRHYFNNETDVCVRWGGDEFVMGFCIPSLDKQYLQELSNNLLKDIGLPIALGNTLSCNVGASIGIVTAPKDGSELDSLIAKADETMYQVKNSGRNQCLFAS